MERASISAGDAVFLTGATRRHPGANRIEQEVAEVGLNEGKNEAGVGIHFGICYVDKFCRSTLKWHDDLERIFSV